MFQALKGKTKKIVNAVAASVLLFSQFAIAPVAHATNPSPWPPTDPNKVGICHATDSQSNPYTTNSVDKSSIDEVNNQYLNGHGDHTGPTWHPGIANHSWGDIIPPFTNDAGHSFPGRNWDAAGQAIWNNSCEITTIKVNKQVDTNGNDVYDNDGGNTTANTLGFRWGLDQGANNRNMGTSTYVNSGSHSITENQTNGYTFTGWYYTQEKDDSGKHQQNCTHPVGTTLPIAVSIDKDETKEITLCNKKVPTGDIKVKKYEDVDGSSSHNGNENDDLGGWKIRLYDSNWAYLDELTTSDTDWVKFENLPYGTYYVCEKNQTGWNQTDPSANEGVTNDSPNKAEEAARCLQVSVNSDYEFVSFGNQYNPNGTLKVVKNVINDNGGTKTYANFHFTTSNGGAQQSFDADASDTNHEDGVKTFTLTGGTQFNVAETEANQDGYTTTYSGDCSGTIVTGETKTCVITNNDNGASLTVIKHVVNNNGGTKVAPDFTMYVNGTNVSDNSFPGNENGTTVTLNPGSYSISENGLTGYTGTKSGDCSGTIALGEHKTCTITNDDDAPVLILIKQVINLNGGTADEDDWFLKADGPTDISGWGGASSGSSFKAGTYTLSEWGFPQGYSASDWECVGGSQNGSQITLGLGEHAACTITNYDNPAKITVEKEVVNDNGGNAKVSDFDLWVDHKQVLSGVTNNFEGNEWYYVKETDGPHGYKQTSLKCWDLTGRYPTLVGNPFYAKLGHDYKCKIVNDDIAPKLKIVKDAQPDSIQVFDFTLNGEGVHKTFKLNDNGTSYPIDNDKTFYLNKGWFSVTEDQTDGWYLDSIQCYGTHEFTDLDKGKVVVKLNLGDDVTCKFTNKKFGEIKGFKFEDVNKNGKFDQSEPLLSGWTITVEKLHDSFTGSTVTDQNGWYKFDDLKEGWYKVCEEQQDGWVQTKPASNDGCETVWIHPGDHDFVKFGNFKLGKVTGIKFNDINGNGVRDNNEPTLKDWTITLTNICDEEDQPEVSVDQVLSVASHPACKEVTKPTKTDATGAYSFDDLDVGTYVVCEVQQANWTQTAPKTKDGCVEFTIETSGQEEVVDFGNKAKPQVLGETTELVNTGASTSKGLLVGLSILGALGALHLTVRRKSYTN